MKIEKFTIKNFRSITKAYQIPLSNLTILIGPNNEGKSNVLYALSYAISMILNQGEGFRLRKRSLRFIRKRTALSFSDVDYIFERDFPLALKGKKELFSEFILEFKLTKEDNKNFKRKLKYSLKNNLIIKIKTGEKDPTKVVPFDGDVRIKSIDNPNGFEKISDFFRSVWNFQYIPTIRTAELALEIIDSMIEEELGVLEGNKKYSALIDQIEKIQEPILKKLSKNLTKEMTIFLPTIKNVNLVTQNRIRRVIRQACVVKVDDGYDTDINMKGDGIKSLLAISVLKNSVFVESSTIHKSLTLAIEEPESHLHPRAIQSLKKVIESISENNQVIITTHSPIFIDRLNLESNIIVNSSSAVPSISIQQLREILGVEISDNLRSANYVLLVEGEEDRRIITSILKSSTSLSNAIQNGILIIKPIKGAGNLSYNISQYKGLLCSTIVFLDNDKSGNYAFQKAEEKDLLSLKDVFFARMQGYKESEIEDLIIPSIYIDEIKSKFGVILAGRTFRNNKKAWSGRVRDTFLMGGKPWDDKIEMEVKKVVADEFEKKGFGSVYMNARKPFESLISHLQSQISLIK